MAGTSTPSTPPDEVINTLIALHGKAQGTYDHSTFGDYVMLWGYLYTDPYDNTKMWLYVSFEFDEYLEFFANDMGPTINLFSASHPLAGTLVWVKKDATVRRVREETAQREGDFLQGAISRGFLSQLGASSMLGAEALSRKAIDPTSGGGCGTGSTLSSCG